jgi:hypothetical protein
MAMFSKYVPLWLAIACWGCTGQAALRGGGAAMGWLSLELLALWKLGQMLLALQSLRHCQNTSKHCGCLVTLHHPWWEGD